VHFAKDKVWTVVAVSGDIFTGSNEVNCLLLCITIWISEDVISVKTTSEYQIPA
jgi:hypothetical protein